MSAKPRTKRAAVKTAPKKKRKKHRDDEKQPGGRSTAAGVGYEERIAAYVAVHMLSGEGCRLWDWATGDEIASVTLQSRDDVDDVVIERRSTTAGRALVQAKDYRKPIPVTSNERGVFREIIDAFVREFRKHRGNGAPPIRLTWAVPSTVGRNLTKELHDILHDHRATAADSPLATFVRNRSNPHRHVFKTLHEVTQSAWKTEVGRNPSEEELRDFLRTVYIEVIEFGRGQHAGREAETLIRHQIAAKPAEALRIWRELEGIFKAANERGLTETPASLRRKLSAAGCLLKTAPDFASDVETLQATTCRNLARLRDHTYLRFGSRAEDRTHINRVKELGALSRTVKTGHRLLTGEPGCGKSGILCDLARSLEAEGTPVVVLLAEEILASTAGLLTPLPGVSHSLDEVLAHWPTGARGLLITDALDAVRNPASHAAMRSVLRDVLQGASGWRVVASVREFDLKYGRELRELFPGSGTPGYELKDFEGVAHFHLSGLHDSELESLANERPAIRPFLESAKGNAKSHGLECSPFYLRLAAELLASGVSSRRLADWNSPALLLSSFWQRRVDEGEDADVRNSVLPKLCQAMVAARSLGISAKELSLSADDKRAIRGLRSAGILQSPALRFGVSVGEEVIRFSHHLLYDYAIARTLIPLLPDRFAAFAASQPMLPVFFRQSFLFALEEIWDSDPSRKPYWDAAIRIEGVSSLSGVSRILGPVLAARRVQEPEDLLPLLTALMGATITEDSPPARALRHLASGLQDAPAELIRAGAGGWCDFAVRIAALLAVHPFIEATLTHVLARLNDAGAATTTREKSHLNEAGRLLLAHYLPKPVNRTWKYPPRVAVETICRTFAAASKQSESALLSLMSEERITQFPHDDLFWLANKLPLIETGAGKVITRLCECVFGPEPQGEEWEEMGTAILPMRIRTRDQWSSAKHAFADFYIGDIAKRPTLATELACVAANSKSHDRAQRLELLKSAKPLAVVEFRGRKCVLIEDLSHVWAHGSFPDFGDNGRIVLHFRHLLRHWATERQVKVLDDVLDALAVHNQSAWLWSQIFEVGAEMPSTVGVHLAPFLRHPTVFVNPDYAYSATSLLGSLHHVGTEAERAQIEKTILELPRSREGRAFAGKSATKKLLLEAQNRLLSVLKDSNLILPKLRTLRNQREADESLSSNRPPEGIIVRSVSLTAKELSERRGIRLGLPENKRMSQLLALIKQLIPPSGGTIDGAKVAKNWKAVLDAEATAKRYRIKSAAMAADLWGHVTSLCCLVAGQSRWAKTNRRWHDVERILIAAADDPEPRADQQAEERADGFVSWGLPAPRIDAARGLPFLARRLGKVAPRIRKTLYTLLHDPNYVVRAELAQRLPPLCDVDREFMWKLIETVVENDQKYTVLGALILPLRHLFHQSREKALAHLQRIQALTKQATKGPRWLDGSLASTFLFLYLEYGDAQCQHIIEEIIERPDDAPDGQLMRSLLHQCRDGGWLDFDDPTAENGKESAVRLRTWRFFSKVLNAAQMRIGQLQSQWEANRSMAEPELGKNRAALSAALASVDSVTQELFFASGAFDEKRPGGAAPVSNIPRMQRFWREALPLFRKLVSELHPHIVYNLVQTFRHLLPVDPQEAFLLAARAIRNGAKAGFQHESLAVKEVVEIVQRVLADHRDIFSPQSGANAECLDSLLAVLDLFVEAGWPEARQLTHRLEDIYR